MKVKLTKDYGSGPVDIEIEVDATKTGTEDIPIGGKTVKAKWMWCKCPTCDNCRLYLDTPYKNNCAYGGPYAGYIDV